MTPNRAIETAADYADALMASRRAKHLIVLILLLVLLVQLVIFFLTRFDVIDLYDPGTLATAATTQPSFDWRLFLNYGIGITAFLGVSLSIVLSFVLLLIVNIMLVGRLIGAGRVTSAYLWCLIFVVLLFPWQSFLNNVGLTPDRATFKVPGVLYTFQELADPELGAKFPNQPLPVAILKWARFVAFPLLAIVILLAIQVKSSRGMRQALGEDLPPTTAPPIA